ncbi:MAG: hypothetical protein MO852_07855 [Candidatus Devosia euplotis]|nr:hypothetical protein [Candidatus Devosia euplotis]
MGEFWSRFQMMFVLAVLIERSVETYLKVTEQDGRSFYDSTQNLEVKTQDATQAAMIAALILSILVAAAGGRIIATLVTLSDNADIFKATVWNGVDVMVSAGLMAGGADVFHRVAEIIAGELARIETSTKTGRANTPARKIDLASCQAMVSAAAMAEPKAARTFTISIARPAASSADEGELEFTDSGLAFKARCWWDPKNRIDAGTYTRCSRTHMAASGLEAIYLPDAVPKMTGAKEIFIHGGRGPDKSLGCIVVESALFAKLWQHIEPTNGFNITVIVSDI